MKRKIQETENTIHGREGMQDIFTLSVSCHESQRDVMSAWSGRITLPVCCVAILRKKETVWIVLRWLKLQSDTNVR